MTWEATENAMTAALYNALGQLVTYVPRSGASSSIRAIVDDGNELIGPDVEVSERITTARLQVASIATPRRGDRIEMASGQVYMVDGVETSNNVEHLLILTDRDQ